MVFGDVTFGDTSGSQSKQAKKTANKTFDPEHPSREDYTVGWICALPVPEWQASRLLFDKEHGDISLPNATYQYVYGEINGHNVVMGCLPDSQMGTTATAQVASEMHTLFPEVRFALLVGVAGGVWRDEREHDVRLGDVVVSRPDSMKRTGGVIQYDYGKAMQDSDGNSVFVETGSLNVPPMVLLSALGKLRSATKSKFNEHLQSYDGDEWPDYANRPSDPDKLFKSSYIHPKGVPTCDDCPTTEEVIRKARMSTRPKVHYGTIASGNEVMKDSQKRDEIAKKHDILAFEMEAAGLVNYFPCLVVRGICDYCDSHKNKAWQHYAAAAAAAWAKELLRNVSPTDVKTAKPIGEAA